jgi:hypothetical protein
MKLAKLDEHGDVVIAVEIRFRGKTTRDRAKHIEALMKLLDKRAASYKLTSFWGGQ